MRKYGRIDNVHREIVEALRNFGCTVQSLANEGNGCPDVVCGFRGHNFLFEFKNGKGELTAAEKEWLEGWKGHAHVVRSFEEALKVLYAGT